MAKESKTVGTAETAPAAESSVKAEKKFAVAKLRANCVKLYGVTRSTFDGAMYGHNEDSYTIDEVKKIINVWLNGGEN